MRLCCKNERLRRESFFRGLSVLPLLLQILVKMVKNSINEPVHIQQTTQALVEMSRGFDHISGLVVEIVIVPCCCLAWVHSCVGVGVNLWKYQILLGWDKGCR